jgi:hypothetical protein
MKVVICFDTEDAVGMKNCIKTVDHLAKAYYQKRIEDYGEMHISRREMAQILQTFYKRHRYYDYDKNNDDQRQLFDKDIMEGWDVRVNYKLTKDFVDEMCERKENNKGFLFWSI